MTTNGAQNYGWAYWGVAIWQIIALVKVVDRSALERSALIWKVAVTSCAVASEETAQCEARAAARLPGREEGLRKSGEASAQGVPYLEAMLHALKIT